MCLKRCTIPVPTLSLSNSETHLPPKHMCPMPSTTPVPTLLSQTLKHTCLWRKHSCSACLSYCCTSRISHGQNLQASVTDQKPSHHSFASASPSALHLWNCPVLHILPPQHLSSPVVAAKCLTVSNHPKKIPDLWNLLIVITTPPWTISRYQHDVIEHWEEKCNIALSYSLSTI